MQRLRDPTFEYEMTLTAMVSKISVRRPNTTQFRNDVVEARACQFLDGKGKRKGPEAGFTGAIQYRVKLLR